MRYEDGKVTSVIFYFNFVGGRLRAIDRQENYLMSSKDHCCCYWKNRL